MWSVGTDVQLNADKSISSLVRAAVNLASGCILTVGAKAGDVLREEGDNSFPQADAHVSPVVAKWMTEIQKKSKQLKNQWYNDLFGSWAES